LEEVVKTAANTFALEPLPRQLPLTDRPALRAALQAADTPTLLMVLTQLSGDETFLERFAPHLRSPMVGPSDVPAELDAELRERLFHRLTETHAVPEASLPQALLQKMMSIGVGEPVSEEFIPLLIEQMGFEPRRLHRHNPERAAPPAGFKVLVIGAGLTGLLAGIKLGEAGYDYEIIEKNQDIGGTWFENVYPGVGVDTPSHFYSYSFALSPEWSSYFPKGGEMQSYLLSVAEKYQLRQRISFQTKVIACVYDEASGTWRVTIEGPTGSRVIEARAVINAHGPVNRWSIPAIPGLKDFKGVAMHTAGWKPEVDLTGKRVALIGTGASAAQLGPAIVDQVAHLTVFQRSKHWVLNNPDYAKRVDDGVKWALRHIPFFAEWFRFRAYWFASDSLYPNVKVDPNWPQPEISVSAQNEAARQYCLYHMNTQLEGRPDLIEKLLPDYPVFSKRIVLDGGWLAMMRREHVELETSPIECITADGIVTQDGRAVPVDVIIFATGFEIAKMLGSLTVIGRDGRNLGEEWGADDPRAYLGVAVPGYPNFFLTVGPNSAPNHAAGQNLISEAQVHYIIECLDELVKRRATAMEPTVEAYEAFNRQVDRDLQGLVWTHPKAKSYYRNSKGRVFLSNPYRLVDYWGMTRSPKAGDYHFE
jgi:4-hydroxyacetophenone monooxygenase